MKVLIAIDQSECSLRAVETVADRCWPEGTTFEVISVIEFSPAQYGMAYDAQSVVAIQAQIEDFAQKYIDGKVQELQALFGKGRVTGKLLNGFIAETILEEAKNWNCDLIVMGSHGRKGFAKFFLGSVAEKVVCNAHCSVEVVKDKMKIIEQAEKEKAAAKKAPLVVGRKN